MQPIEQHVAGVLRQISCQAFKLRVSYEDESVFRSKRFIFCANHQSYLDGPLLTSVLMEYFLVSPVLEASAVRAPLRGLLTRVQAIPVSRHSQLRHATLRSCMRALQSRSVLIFPEGKRARTRELCPFQMGAALLSHKAGVPLVPIAILGTEQVLPVGAVFPRWHPLEIRVGTPLLSVSYEPAENPSRERLAHSTSQLRQAIERLRDRSLPQKRSHKSL